MNRFSHDAHVHLDLYKNVEEVIKYIEEKKSYTIAVTNLPILYEKISKRYSDLKYIRFALGLHPELIKNYPEQIPYLWSNLEKCRYIGEVGLDFKNIDLEEKNLQINTFTRLIRTCSLYGGKILSIHSRGAANEVVKIIGPDFNGKVILHWYSGSITELRKAIRNGYYFSINIDMLKSKKGKELIKIIPLDKILVESDGPFTKGSEVNYDLKFVDEIVSALSALKDVSSDRIFKTFKENFKSLLN